MEKHVPNHQPDIFWLSVISPPSSSWVPAHQLRILRRAHRRQVLAEANEPRRSGSLTYAVKPRPVESGVSLWFFHYWSTMALVEAPIQSMASASEASNCQKTLDPLRTTACPRPCLCPPTCSFQGPSVTMEAPPCVCRWSQCYTSPISCEKTWSVHLLDSRVDPLAEIPWWIHYTSTIIINCLHTSIQYSEHSPDIYTSIIYSRSTKKKQHCS